MQEIYSFSVQCFYGGIKTKKTSSQVFKNILSSHTVSMIDIRLGVVPQLYFQNRNKKCQKNI